MAKAIIHYGGVSMRVTGSGNLDMNLKTLSDVTTKNLRPFGMANGTEIQPTRLTNLNTQKASLTVSVDVIDEWFLICSITIWMKPIYTQYPSALNAQPSE